ncbi:MAG: GNAT family N-acetyltransferase [Bacilli bacterium]|nr:GNAT family N-acetyltransferase [Bacilli bacterium]
MNLNIRLATIKDLNSINWLFKEVICDINNTKKINLLWGEVHPFCEFEKDINNKEMYVIEKEDKLIGSFTISKEDDPEYHAINWNSINKKNFYASRLVILPNEQGKGYAKKALDYIVNYAKVNDYEFIRAVIHKNNIYSIGLCEKNGFIKVLDESWIFNGEIFWGFEKEIKKLIKQ